LVIHDNGVGPIEIGDKLTHPLNVYEITSVGTEEEVRVQARLQFAKGEAGEIGFFLDFSKDVIFFGVKIDDFFRAKENCFTALLDRDDFEGAY
jgi:hypothetical protein